MKLGKQRKLSKPQPPHFEQDTKTRVKKFGSYRNPFGARASNFTNLMKNGYG